MDFGENIWGFFWFFIWGFVFVAYLMALFSVLTDLFRDHGLNGWLKAVWIFFLIFVPFLTLFIYLIARGNSMAARSVKEAKDADVETQKYIRSVVATTSPTEEISKAKQLLDAGTITQAEFDKIKANALAATGA